MWVVHDEGPSVIKEYTFKAPSEGENLVVLNSPSMHKMKMQSPRNTLSQLKFELIGQIKRNLCYLLYNKQFYYIDITFLKGSKFPRLVHLHVYV